MRKFNKTVSAFRQKGFALLTVLLMSALLLMLMISLINLTTQTLYRATVDVERSSVMCVAENAINEAMLNIKNSTDNNWGEAKTEKLFLRCGGQDLRVASLKTTGIPSVNSQFSVQGKACFYISFDPNDAFFNGKKYYSVNNLNSNSTVTGCRGDVPPHSAEIIATVAVGSTVRHVAVILQVAPGWKMQNGSRGEVNITTNLFELESFSGDAPNFHSNYGTAGVDDGVKFSDLADSQGKIFSTDLAQGATVTCTSLIQSPSSLDPGKFKPDQPFKNIPVLPVIDLIPSPVSTIPSGYYKVNGSSLERYDKDPADEGVLLESFGNDSYLDAPTNKVKFKNSILEVSAHVQVAFDPVNYTTDPNACGNLTIMGAGVKFTGPPGITQASIYAPGDGSRDYTLADAPYNYGNVKIVYDVDDKKVLEGKGNIYSLGTIDIEGFTINAGQTSEDIALCASGDIKIRTEENTLFRGLVYTEGDFSATVDKVGTVNYEKKGKRGKTTVKIDYNYLNIEGALIAVGKDPNSADPNVVMQSIFDPGEIDISSDLVKIKFDDTVLESLKGGSGSSGTILKVQSWHEF